VRELAILTRALAVVGFGSALPIDFGRRSTLIRVVPVVEHRCAGWAHMCESAFGVRAVPVLGFESAGLGNGACVASLPAALVGFRSSVAGRIHIVCSEVRKFVYKFAIRPVAYPIVTLVEALLPNSWHGIGVAAYYITFDCRVTRIRHHNLVVSAMGKLMREDATVHHASPAILLIPARPSRFTGGFCAKDEWLIKLPCSVLNGAWWCGADVRARRVHVRAGCFSAYTKSVDVVAWHYGTLVDASVCGEVGHADIFCWGCTVLRWRLKLQSNLGSRDVVAELAVVAKSTKAVTVHIEADLFRLFYSWLSGGRRLAKALRY
jgi:hypothetical protein